MKTIIGLSAAAALAALATTFSATPGKAAITYPWCAHYIKGGGGAPSCGFVSFEQCMATVRGIQGTCAMNPAYEPAAYPPPSAKRRNHR